MTNYTQISVIVPSYNYETYLEQALISIAESDFDKDRMEIIVVDDKSSDQSVALVKKLKAILDIKLRLICNNTNLGLIRTRNTGIVHSNGDFLFFLDPDNFIGKECLREHYQVLLTNSNYSACYAPVQVFDDATGKCLSLLSNEYFDFNKLATGNYIDSMAMYRKKDLIGLGMYDTKMPPYGWEDYELWLRMGQRGKSVYFIEGKPLSFYRNHGSNMCGTFTVSERNILKYYLNNKYNLHLELEMNPSLQRYLSGQRTYNSQLFFSPGTKLQNSPETAVQSYVNINGISIPIEYGEGKLKRRLSFRFNSPLNIRQLRFYPLNDYVCLSIESVDFLREGKKVDPGYVISSNALEVDEKTFLFDHKNPQINLDMNSVSGVRLDEVVFNVSYLKFGDEVFPMVHENYRLKMSLCSSGIINMPLLKTKINRLLRRKDG